MHYTQITMRQIEIISVDLRDRPNDHLFNVNQAHHSSLVLPHCGQLSYYINSKESPGLSVLDFFWTNFRPVSRLGKDIETTLWADSLRKEVVYITVT